MSNKLQGKDLINIGIFAAIYFVVVFYRIYVGSYSYLHSFIGCAGTADRGHSHDAVLLQDQEVWNVNDLRFAGGYFNAANWNGLLVYSYGTGFWADCRFNAEAFWV